VPPRVGSTHAAFTRWPGQGTIHPAWEQRLTTPSWRAPAPDSARTAGSCRAAGTPFHPPDSPMSVVWLNGPVGAGKSTLAHAVRALVHPVAAVALLDEDVVGQAVADATESSGAGQRWGNRPTGRPRSRTVPAGPGRDRGRVRLTRSGVGLESREPARVSRGLPPRFVRDHQAPGQAAAVPLMPSPLRPTPSSGRPSQ